MADSKRLIGRKFSDDIVMNDTKIWPFSIIEGEGDKPVIEVSYKGEMKHFAPEQISSMILAKLKRAAEAYIGMEVWNVVITVPAYFNNSQRQATIDAGTIAGLNVMQIVNEPTAVAIAYRHLKNDSICNLEARNILVFDLGGGTFDVSLVSVANDSVEVKATSGDTHLGGVDFDNSVVNHFVDEFQKKYSKDIKRNIRALERLRVAFEKAKRNLSSVNQITIEIDCLYDDLDFSSTLSRDQFEMLNMSSFEKCIKSVEKCLTNAMMNKGDVDDVVLVGGSSRIPKVQELLQDFFDGKVLCQSLNPDEAVVYGAAIHAATLSGARHHRHTLVDITPLSVGIRYPDGILKPIIHKNSQIPMKINDLYQKSNGYQTSISLDVYEDNHLSRKLRLDGIPRDLTVDSINVTTSFEIDANSILTVTSWEDRTSRQITIIENSGNLSTEEINKMMEEAKKYEMEDIEHMRLEKIKFEVRNFLSNMSLEKSEVQDVIGQTNQWLDLNSQLNDVGKFEDKLKELQDFTSATRLKESMDSLKLRKARFEVEKYVGKMKEKVDNHNMIKFKGKRRLKRAINSTNEWLDLNIHFEYASKFEEKLKELKNSYNGFLADASRVETGSSIPPIGDTTGNPKKSSFFFLNYAEEGESSSKLQEASSTEIGSSNALIEDISGNSKKSCFFFISHVEDGGSSSDI